MSISRREFLKRLGVAVGGGVVGYGLFQFLAAKFPEQVWSLHDTLTDPALQEGPVGSLSDEVLQTLMVTVHTLVNMPIKTTHYEGYFTWHAQNRPGYKTLYEQFTATLNTSTRQSAECEFVNCDAATRYGALEQAFEVRTYTGRLEKIQAGIFERKWILFDKYIVREIFSLFSRTDTWVLLGYEAWPGTSRGLDNYTQRPSGFG